MTRRIHFAAAAALLALVPAALPATATEPGVTVGTRSGEGRAFTLSELKRIDIGSRIGVQLRDGSTTEFEIPEITRITLGDVTGIERTTAESVTMKVFRQQRTVQIDGIANGGSVLVHDINGNRIASLTATGGSVTVSFSSRTRGVYLITLPGGHTEKVII